MKNKITCLLAGAALFGATANAEIVLADGLSASGYIDINATDIDGAPRSFDSTEFEIGLNFAPAESAWTATAELSYETDGDSSATNLETVAITYQHNDALSLTFGRVYTYQGLESHDAPDNYFISYAGIDTTTQDAIDLYSADFADGVCVDYNVGDVSLGVWSSATSGADFEYYASYSGIENLTLAVAIADDEDGGDVTNIMATYEFGDFTIMAENVDSEGGDLEVYDVTSVTVAYPMGDTTLAVRAVDGEYGADDYEKISISAFHALSDNVAVGVEYSDAELGTNESVSGFGVELLYVF
jgi:hypothetical protein